jgi:hypothetical protein
MTTYLDSWNTSNSPTKGNIGIDSNSNSSTVYSLFQLNSVTTVTGRKLNVTYLSDLVRLRSLCIRFFKTGNLGANGSSGSSGSAGSYRLSGAISGSSGLSGKWISGSSDKGANGSSDHQG